MSITAVKPVEADKLERVEPAVQVKQAKVGSDLLRGVRVALEVRLGKAPMTVEEVMALKQGSVVTLESSLADPVELYLNGTLVARGDVVAVGENYGVRIVEIVTSAS